MRKNIKNYTSEVPASRSITNIQNLLVAKGAEKIMFDYNDGKPVGMMFLIPTAKGKLPVQLPARVANVAKIMYETNYPNQSQEKQAERTAWKNLHDWVDAQLALIETDMVKLEEVFLPYIVMGSKGTVFEHFQSGNLQLGEGGQNE